MLISPKYWLQYILDSNFPCFFSAGRMDAAGPWPPFLHLDMEQTLPVQQFQ